MAGLIKKFDASSEYYFREGCFITELLNSTDDEVLSVAKARVEPGVTTSWHRLTGTTERYIILEGQGEVEVGDIPPTRVSAGDVVVIPQDVAQRIRNVGEEDLVFFAICTPRFCPENYQEGCD